VQNIRTDEYIPRAAYRLLARPNSPSPVYIKVEYRDRPSAHPYRWQPFQPPGPKVVLTIGHAIARLSFARVTKIGCRA
jgi:hypothetical protein